MTCLATPVVDQARLALRVDRRDRPPGKAPENNRGVEYRRTADRERAAAKEQQRVRLECVRLAADRANKSENGGDNGCTTRLYNLPLSPRLSYVKVSRSKFTELQKPG